MTVLENASYVELSRPEIDGRLTCSFCDRTSNHDHEFSGRFDLTPIHNILHYRVFRQLLDLQDQAG